MERGLSSMTLEQGRAPGGRLAVLLSAFALLALLGLGALPARANAAVSTHKLIWGPTDAAAFNTYADLGAGLYEFTINWSLIAPTKPAEPTNPSDPAYQWTPAVDEAIANAQAHGMQVVLEVSGAPGWANGGRPWPFAPTNPQDYADFAAAASKRWPAIHYWQIWGEPSRRPNFMPLPKHVFGEKLTRSQQRGPELYAQILDDSYVSLKQVNPENIVIGGNTYSGGDIRPLAYIKALRLPNGKPPRMDMYGQNPFGFRRPDLSKDLLQPGNGVADFCDLDVIVEYVDRYLSRRPQQGQVADLHLRVLRPNRPQKLGVQLLGLEEDRGELGNRCAQDHPQLEADLHLRLVRARRRSSRRRGDRGQPWSAHL